ncbi:MAG: hypothetical protein ACREP8_06770, partial [Candidatus Binatia bacterium]
DVDGLADAIRRSLSTPEAEKRSRMQRLRQAVREKDVYWWCERFLKSLAQGKENTLGSLQTTSL